MSKHDHPGCSPLKVRTYGSAGPVVLVLHGGPGAAGHAAALARELAGSFRVIEPWQRGSGDEPLTVDRHIADLHELIANRSAGVRPALVGESWGAMLALAYAAAHPASAGPLVLVGCGTFDPVSRARLNATLEERISDDLRRQLQRLEEEFPDPDQRLRERFKLTGHLYDYDAEPAGEEAEPAPPFDLAAHLETWNDMLRMQQEGVYPAAFAAIKSSVLMLHGTYDPHPGRMIRETLRPHLPQLEYREFERCGHSPWAEKAVRAEFFTVLREWLLQRVHAPKQVENTGAE